MPPELSLTTVFSVSDHWSSQVEITITQISLHLYDSSWNTAARHLRAPPPPWVWRQRKKMVNKSFVNTLYGKGNNLLFWAGLFSSYRTLSSCLSHWLFISKQQATFWLLMSWEKRLLQFGPTDVFGRVWKVALNFDSIQDWFPHSVCVCVGGETQCTCWL